MVRGEFEILEENDHPVARTSVPERRTERIVALGRALSDPIRVRMLGMMAEGRSCCELPDLGVPASSDENPGICVCEFEGYFAIGQSRVSYHLGKLKEAGLVREERRGRWSFYSLDREAAGRLLAEAAEQLSVELPMGEEPAR